MDVTGVRVLKVGPELDRMVHDLIFGDEHPEEPVAPYSTRPEPIAWVMAYISERCRYFGLVARDDGWWVAVAADEVSELAVLDGSAGDGERTQRFEATTPMLAVCGLAVSIGYPAPTLESEAAPEKAQEPCFEWKGSGSFAGGKGGV